MEYIELCKFVFGMEQVDWELHAYKNRKRQLVQAKQISVYLGNWFFPSVTLVKLSEPFNQDHSTTLHGINTIKNLLFSDKQFRAKMDKYLTIIRQRINEEDHKLIERQLQDDSFRAKLIDSMAQMEIIAKVYCDMTNQKLINK